MSNYELEMFYGRRSCKVLDGESVCVCVCVNVSYLHGPEPNEWFYEWNSYQDDTRQLQEMRCSPDKEGDGIWRRRNWLRILNTRSSSSQVWMGSCQREIREASVDVPEKWEEGCGWWLSCQPGTNYLWEGIEPSGKNTGLSIRRLVCDTGWVLLGLKQVI